MYQPSHVSSVHETVGALTASSRGTLVTGGATNTKGSYVSIGAATTVSWEAMTIFVARPTGSSGGLNGMIDIALGGAGSEAIIVPDLYFAAGKLQDEHTLQLTLPLHVPSGSQLRARMAESVGNGTIDLSVAGHHSGLGGAPGFSRAVALFTPASSRGVAIDPGATANTKGAWAELTSSCPEDVAAMFGLIGYNNDVARAAGAQALLDIGIGAAAAEQTVYPNYTFGWSTQRDGPSNCVRIPPFACGVPKTTRIAARAQAEINTAGDRTFDLALYGLVP